VTSYNVKFKQTYHVARCVIMLKNSVPHVCPLSICGVLKCIENLSL